MELFVIEEFSPLTVLGHKKRDMERIMMNQKNCCGKCVWVLVFFIAYLFVGAYALLWSWNTGADLFKWPVAEYRHALAATLAFVLIVLPFCCTFRHSHDGACCTKADGGQPQNKP